jgi:hypothetical protein
LSFTSRNRGQTVLHTDVNQYADFLNGTSVASPQAGFPIQFSHATTPTWSIRNVHSTGTPLRVYKTVAGVDTDLLKVHNTTGVTVKDLTVTGTLTQTIAIASLTAAISQNKEINVKEYGVLADGSDDTGRIQAIIDVYRTNFAPISVGEGLNLYFPPGKYSISSLDFTKLDNLSIRCAVAGTIFYAERQPVARPVFDFTGSSDVYLFGAVVSGTNYGSSAAPNITPQCAYLFANSEPASAGNSNANMVEFCSSSGYFGVATLYLCVTVDMTVIWYHGDTVSAIPSVLITNNNGSGVVSVGSGVAVATGPGTTGNLTFINLGGTGVDITGNDSGGVTEAIYNVNFFGGSIDGNLPGFCVRTTGTANATFDNFSFYNTQFTSGVAISGGGVFNLQASAHYSWRVMGCQFQGINAADAFVKMASNTVLYDFHISGWDRRHIGSSARKVISQAAIGPTTTESIIGGFIDCQGGTLAPGGSISMDTEVRRAVMSYQAGATGPTGRIMTVPYGVAPTVACSAGWGSGNSVSIGSGTEVTGTIVLNTGTTCTANPTITLTWPQAAYKNRPQVLFQYVPSSSPTSQNTPQLFSYTETTTACVVNCYGAVASGGAGSNFTATDSKTYTFRYLVIC